MSEKLTRICEATGEFLSEVEVLERKWKFIEQAQSAIIAAGGSFMTKDKIEKMSVGDFLGLVTPNLITLKVEFDSETYVKRTNP